MFKKIWENIKEILRKIINLFRPNSSAVVPTQLQSQVLSKSEYEHFFLQLLEGVKNDWDEGQVSRFFTTMQSRASIEDWRHWFSDFSEQLRGTSGTHQGELTQRLLLLSHKMRSLPGLEEFAHEIASLATQLSDRQHSDHELTLVPPSPDSAQGEVSWFDQGLTQLDAEDYQGALLSFERVIAVDANDHRAWINRGNALTNLGQFEEAIASFDRGIALQPNSHIAWNNRGDALFECNRIQEAIASWDRALELDPQSAETWYNRGMGLGALNRWTEAIESWDRALALNPQDEESWFNRGLGLAQLSQWEEAIASWDQALELKPDWRDAWINKGLALQKLGRYAEAIEANDRAIALPNSHSPQ